jgi:hypothetical protein
MMQQEVKSMIVAEIFPLHDANFPNAFCIGESNISAA